MSIQDKLYILQILATMYSDPEIDATVAHAMAHAVEDNFGVDTAAFQALVPVYAFDDECDDCDCDDDADGDTHLPTGFAIQTQMEPADAEAEFQALINRIMGGK